MVVTLASKVNVSEKCSTTLILESATTDILCIVISLAIIGIINTGQAKKQALATMSYNQEWNLPSKEENAKDMERLDSVVESNRKTEMSEGNLYFQTSRYNACY